MLRGKRLTLTMEGYLEQNRVLEARTREILRRGFQLLVEAVGDIRIKRFDRRQAERFQAHLHDIGLSPASCNIYVRAVRPVFRWADLDPFERLKLFKVPKKNIRTYTPAEFGAILEACPNNRWRAICLAAKTAALRIGEILNLTVADVDFDNCVIYIQPKPESHRTWRWIAKDKDIRELPLINSQIISQVLLDLEDCQPYMLLTSETYQKRLSEMRAGTLLDRVRGRPDQSYLKTFKRILKRAGIKQKTFHDLRRTCLTEWSRHLEPKDLMDLAGHSNISTTMTYYVALDESRVNRARLASEKMLGAAENVSTTPKRKTLTKVGGTGLEPVASCL